MAIAIVSTVFVLILCAQAARADASFRGEARLPMQWSVTGRVTWSAPRRVALAFMPALAIMLLGCFTWLSMTVPPRPGQAHLVWPVLIGMGGGLIAIQLCHVWLIARTLRRAADQAP